MNTGYDNLYVTTEGIPRTKLTDLPPTIEVTCHRSTGWVINEYDIFIAGEFCEQGLCLDVDGVVIVNSLDPNGSFI